ncbi:peptidase M23 [Paenibacillus antri]|uniref:Peptidase M23 n=1 Tax=Paenibacillus antri TaxID=2582848 RepID=A0A5R9G8B6_9BACL|nr:M23 family metallopeptidase [Paenibacillus antri]TLS50606.1 peptidase M23 [Paenibacillus antri]
MLKRFLLPTMLAVSLAVASVGAYPQVGVAASSELDKVNAQLKKLKEQMKSAEASQKQAEKEIERIRGFQEAGKSELARLENEIAVTSKKIESINEQMYEVEESLNMTVEELVKAEERVVTRDGLLKSRLRLLYMNGVVSYLDVLLSSTSFVDFLDRIDALQSIVSQDKEILELNIQDKQTVERKKAEVENQLEYVEQLFAETESLKAELLAKKEKKEVAIASLQEEEHELLEMTEDQEKELMAYADEQAKLVKKQKELQSAQKKAQQKKVVKYTGGQLTWPVPDSQRVTSPFATRIHPITGKKHTHTGMDIGAPGGTTIVAAASGEVVLAQWYGGYGNCIIIEHKDGFRTLYGHIRNGGIKVKVGDTVDAGQKIAEVGSTGSSTGNHLHFGVYVDNVAVDPDPYLR